MRAVYLLVLAACLACVLPLSGFVRGRVRRLALTLAPVLVVFLSWDLLATRAGQWHFDPRQTLGPGALGVPVEELGFFLVIPFCAVAAFEAVRRRRR